MRVYIKQLSFNTIIGILPFERVTKQKVFVDISFDYKFTKSNNEFIDYSIVVNLVKQIMKKKKFKLIEDAILVLEKRLKKEFKLSNLYIQITKPDILKDCIVSVSN
ncbi:MAG: dihydroneopterin aldolase [Campylobacterota bacterium]|nr:dihydroneopterin aldolase [Campylobacterota bacterium]